MSCLNLNAAGVDILSLIHIYSDIRTTLDIYTQITDPEVARMVNQVTNRILGLGEEGESGSVQ